MSVRIACLQNLFFGMYVYTMFLVVQFVFLDMLVPCYSLILICIHHKHVLIMMHLVSKSAEYSMLDLDGFKSYFFDKFLFCTQVISIFCINL